MNAQNNNNNKKVVFLTKKQREQLRLTKLKQQQEQKLKYIKNCDQSKRMYQEIGEIGEIKDKNSQTTAPKVQKKVKKIKKQNSDEGEDSRSRSRSKSQEKKKQKKTKKPVLLTQQQIERIQQQQKNKMKQGYLGLIKVKRKEIKQLQKFKTVFNFQWADTQDTTQLASSINVNRVEPKLMFGRGLMAGIDILQQKKENGQQLFTKIDKSMQHWTQKKSSQMTDRDWRIFRQDNDIITKGGKIPNPIRDWSDANIEINILDAIKRFGFQKPKPIQMQAIPIGLIMKDLIALAPTGEGKTFAYLVPLISFLQKLPPLTPQNSSLGPYSIILVPSRELAQQIQVQFQKLTIGLGIRCFTVVGGKNLQFQGLNLQRGCQLLIGTPGRIKDLIQKRYCVLQQCSWVVLDEADKMIDFDMQPDVNYILDSIGTQYKSEVQQIAELQQKSQQIYQRKYRVTHLFSATMPPAIQKLAKKYLRSYCHISIGQPGSGKKQIQQHVQLIQQSQKKQSLGRILKQLIQPIILFVNQKRSCQILSKILEKWGWITVDYHGGKSQQQRQAAVQGFKNGKYHILIATDLASRGLHVEGVTAVINFDAPKTINDYIHRIGRTGRAGKKGLAFTFLTPGDQNLFYDLKQFLTKNDQEIPSQLDNHPASKIKPGSITENIPRRKQILYAQ